MMEETNKWFSTRATLAAIGLKITALDLLAPIKEKVKWSEDDQTRVLVVRCFDNSVSKTA